MFNNNYRYSGAHGLEIATLDNVFLQAHQVKPLANIPWLCKNRQQRQLLVVLLLDDVNL